MRLLFGAVNGGVAMVNPMLKCVAYRFSGKRHFAWE